MTFSYIFFIFFNRLHPLWHIVHLLHHDIYIRKVICEFQVQQYDEIDDVIIPIKLVFVLKKNNKNKNKD